MNKHIQCFDEPAAILGEGPLWDTDTGRIYWVDADQKLLFTLNPQNEKFDQKILPRSPGSYAIRDSGGLIMAYRNQLAFIGGNLSGDEAIETPEIDFAIERFNDGACDRAGRFWVGTMDRRLKDPVGSLFRVNPDLSVVKMEQNLICSNGIAFSPDDRLMYHTDTGAARIYVYDFDLKSGTIENRRIFVDFGAETGRPDGCTIDAEGYLWVALIGAGRVVRIAPDGTKADSICLPVVRPTSVAFGGPDMRTLFITSMRFGMSAEQLAEQPNSGCLFAVTVETPGLSEPHFMG